MKSFHFPNLFIIAVIPSCCLLIGVLLGGNKNTPHHIKFIISHLWQQLTGVQYSNSPQYCYRQSNSTIIFLHLSNETDRWLELEMCAFKSAAVKNKENGVCVLTLHSMQQHWALRRLWNIEFSKLNISILFEGTPLEEWYNNYIKSGNISKYYIWELSDALRYAYLYKYGGKYMDTDSWTLRNLDTLQNVAGWQDIKSQPLIANGVMFFEKGHPFVKAVLEKFSESFIPGQWGSVGPQLVTNVHQSGIVDNSTYTIVEPKVFYPTYYLQSNLSFLSNAREKVEEMVTGSYAVHLWRSTVRKFMWDDYVSPKKGSFVYEFLHEVCLDG